MFDCANVEMRELLPELAAGVLDAATRARVEEHVASCAECASELETIRLVRAAFAKTPVIDAARIVAALPAPSGMGAPGAAPARATPARARRWADWRIAAALTMITVGGLSVAVSERLRVAADAAPEKAAPVIDSVLASAASAQPRAPGTGRAADSGGARTAPAASERPRIELTFGGGVDDLDAASIEALMGALDEIDRAPVAPSAEPDRTPVLPVIEGSGL